MKWSGWFHKKEEQENEQVNPINGLVGVIDGVVVIKNPKNGGVPAILNIPESEHYKVFVGDEQVSGKVSVTGDKVVRVEFFEKEEREDENRLYEYHINVSDDKLQVSIKKVVLLGARFSLAEKELAEEMELEVIIENPEIEPSSRDEIENLLHEKGIMGKIDEENLLYMLNTKQEIEKVILKGRAPFPGKKAYFEKLIKVEEINLIEKGANIAKYIEEEPAIPGVNVFGEEIPAVLKYVPTVLGKGVFMTENIVQATSSGRLVFEEKQICIVPQVIIPRDLTKEDGDIIFEDGDVVVKGSVMEGCFVLAEGMIKVEGGVYDSTLVAKQNIIVGGSFSDSKGYAGWVGLFYSKLYHYTKELVENIKLYNSLFVMNDKHGSLTPIEKEENKRLTNAILKGKEEELREMFLFAGKLEKGQVFEDAVESEQVFQLLQKEWSPEKKGKLNKDGVLFAIELGEAFLKNLEERVHHDEARKIEANTGNNSFLYADGEVNIKGLGTYLCEIESGNKITVKGDVRGGNLTARFSVEVGEYQSYNTKDFLIRVLEPSGKIKIRHRHAETVIEINGVKDVTFEEQRNVDYDYNKIKHKK